MSFRIVNRALSHGGHFESQGNKKLCFCTSSLPLEERLDVQNLFFQHCVIKVYCSCRLLEGLGGKSILFGPWVCLTDKECE